MTIPFQVPENLDNFSMDSADLREWAATLQLKRAEHGVGVHTARLLVAYTSNLAIAMECRLGKGSLLQAQILEEKNERIFRRIPKKYSW